MRIPIKSQILLKKQGYEVLNTGVGVCLCDGFRGITAHTKTTMDHMYASCDLTSQDLIDLDNVTPIRGSMDWEIAFCLESEYFDLVNERLPDGVFFGYNHLNDVGFWLDETEEAYTMGAI